MGNLALYATKGEKVSNTSTPSRLQDSEDTLRVRRRVRHAVLLLKRV